MAVGSRLNIPNFLDTTMYMSTSRQLLSYCAANKGNVFCTLLDTTKAFDRVPSVVLRLLVVMCCNHNTRVTYNGLQSRWFGMLNSIKQGGVLSYTELRV